MKSTLWLPTAAMAVVLGSGSFVYAQTGLHKAEDKSVMVQSLNVTIDQARGHGDLWADGEEIESRSTMYWSTPRPSPSQSRPTLAASSEWAKRVS